MKNRRYLLDTNIMSDLIKNPRGKAAQHIKSVGEDRVCTSVIVASELRYGIAKEGPGSIQKRGETILSLMPVLPYETPADVVYGMLRSKLEAAGQYIGSNDLLITAQAYHLKMVLVTTQLAVLRMMPGLYVEDWLT